MPADSEEMRRSLGQPADLKQMLELLPPQSKRALYGYWLMVKEGGPCRPRDSQKEIHASMAARLDGTIEDEVARDQAVLTVCAGSVVRSKGIPNFAARGMDRTHTSIRGVFRLSSVARCLAQRPGSTLRGGCPSTTLVLSTGFPSISCIPRKTSLEFLRTSEVRWETLPFPPLPESARPATSSR